MFIGINSLDRNNKIRNQSNYENRIKEKAEIDSKITTPDNRIKIFQFINYKLQSLQHDPQILCIKNMDDRNRKILSNLHNDLSAEEFKNLGLDIKTNTNIVSNVLNELGIEKVSKFSLFKNELATAKINALTVALEKYGNFIRILHTGIQPFTRFEEQFPKLQTSILSKKFNIDINFHNRIRDDNKRDQYWVQFNRNHNMGAVATIDDVNKQAIILYNNQSYSLISFKLNSDTDIDARGLYRDLTNNKCRIRYKSTTTADNEQMKFDLGLITDINPLEQQCSNSCGTAAQRFILYRYFKDHNRLADLTPNQRKALSNDISFWQYVHGDCDTVEKFQKMTEDPNFEINSDGSRKIVQTRFRQNHLSQRG